VRANLAERPWAASAGGARASRLCALTLAIAAVGALLLGCASDAEARRATAAPRATKGDVEEGRASYYGRAFNGRRTASGERYDPNKLTAAHKTLPLGTWIRVTRAGGPSVDVRVNDRCGCGGGRIVDLSESAAKRLHMLRAGVVPVRVVVLRP
jgi:rare lipoprotein A